MARENPLGLAIGATAVGFIAGMLVPTTRVEEEKLGPMASDMRERAMDAGQEAMERGKQVAQDAMETARESGQEHAQQMREQVSSS
jgi:gas vesicle protein